MVLKIPSAYQFGPFRLEPGEHRLMREGQVLPLAPKTFELLVYMVENSGRLLLKEEIMQAVWQGSFVEEANLTVTISTLRKLLGPSDSGPQYIETVPKKGYRFTAPVTVLNEPVPSIPANLTEAPLPIPLKAAFRARRFPLAVVAAALLCTAIAAAYFLTRSKRAMSAQIEPARHTLAVLPLRNLKQDPASDFLSFSLADAVITKLGSVGSLTVRPSSAVEKYRGQLLDVPKIAADLQVDTLLTGNFIRDGDALRITYQLIDGKADKILENDTLDLKYDKLLTVQDDVARWIVKGLRLQLSPSEAEQINSAEPVNALAYEYYLRGVDLMAKHQFPLAIGMLERSAAIDPDHALTWAFLGYCYTSAAVFDLGGKKQYQRAQAAEERALSLDPKQLEASMFLANLLVDTGRVEEAVPLLRTALDTNTRHAGLHWELGYAYRFAGMLDESVAECERARQIDPLVRGNGAVLNSYLYLGEYDKFLDSLPDVNQSAFVLFYRGLGEYHKREFERAVSDFDRAYRLDPSPYAQVGMALANGLAHKEAEGLELLRALETQIRQRGVGDAEATYKMAQAYAVLGDSPSALRTLRDSIQNGFFSYAYMLRDPLLANIRSHAQLLPILEMARRRHEEFRRRFF